MKSIIVGYDPGTTSAVAVIDTKKNILLLKSKRNMRKKEVVDSITRLGKPLIVAGDRYPLPKAVEKLASSLGCKPYQLGESLSNREKYRLVSAYIEKIKNDHEKDALASALKAHEEYTKLFKRIDRVLSYLSLSEYYDRVLEMVVLKKAENITDAINIVLNEIREKREELIEEKKKLIEKITPKEIESLRKKIKQQESDIAILKTYNESLKKIIKNLEREIKKYSRKLKKKTSPKHVEELERRIDILEKRLSKSQSLIKKLKTFRKIESRNLIPVIELEEITSTKVKDLDKDIDLTNSVLFVKDFRNVQVLNDYRIRAVITPSIPNKKVLEKINFPVLFEKDVSLKKIYGTLAIDKKEFEEKVKQARKAGFVQWVKGHKKRKL